MYSKEQLTKTFKEVAKFFEIEATLAKIELLDENHCLFYLQESEGKLDLKKLKEELAKELRIGVEVKFLGAREKAQEIGGCGPCGKQLCCASWLKNIPPVPSDALEGEGFTDASEYLGMCGKLRCCLAYLREDFKLPEQPGSRPTPPSPPTPPGSLSRKGRGQATQDLPASEAGKQKGQGEIKKPEKKKFVRVLNLKPRRKH